MDDLQWIGHVPAVPERPDDGHKGTFGTVVVVGGSATMLGAPALCATAALRAGAGLVKLASEERWLPWLLTMQPGATGMHLEALDELEAEAGTVLAVGPGMGQGEPQRRLVAQVLGSDHAMVLDADGLNALAALKRHASPQAWRDAGDAAKQRRSELVVTPHPGEFRRLAEAFEIDGDPTDPHQRPTAAAALARALGAVVLLKGPHTIITDGRRVYRNPTGNPALGTGGCGDVLTGLIAALMAQGMPGFEAAALGAYLHGDAADAWAADHGPAGLLAMELAHQIPAALQRRR